MPSLFLIPLKYSTSLLLHNAIKVFKTMKNEFLWAKTFFFFSIWWCWGWFTQHSANIEINIMIFNDYHLKSPPNQPKMNKGKITMSKRAGSSHFDSQCMLFQPISSGPCSIKYYLPCLMDKTSDYFRVIFKRASLTLMR